VKGIFELTCAGQLALRVDIDTDDAVYVVESDRAN
jgi:hypothetical protein